MTDEVQVSEVPEIENAAPVINENVSANDSVASEPVSSPQQKLLPQSTVDKIVGTRVKEAYARARADAEAQYQQQMSQQTQPNTQGMGGMQQMAPEQIRQMIQQEAYRMTNEAMATQIAQNFQSKMDAASLKYEDFNDKVASLNLNNHPQIVMWTEKLDNAGDVIYDMANNPTKVAHILMLANSGFPELAQTELQKLSSSIKVNDEAKKVPAINEPLSQLRPSNIGTDNGKMTVRDLRQQPWLRG